MSVEDVLKLFSASKKYVDNNYRKTWDDCYKIYQRERVKYHYEGLSDPVVPESFTIIESLVANIAGGKPRFQFYPTAEAQQADTTVLNELIGYYLECNKIDLRSQQWVRDMLMYGTGIMEVSWENGKPKISNIPLRNFIIDPQATEISREKAMYTGHRFLADLNTLENATIYDPETNSYVKRYKNLSKLKNTNVPGDDGKSFDKEFKEALSGSTLEDADAKNTQIEVIRIHHIPTGRIYEVGNRKEMIYSNTSWCQADAEKVKTQSEVDGQLIEGEREVPEIKQFHPYVALRDYIDTSLFFAMGELEVIMDRAEMLNDWEAMDVDNAALINTPVGWVDPQFADLIPEIEVAPNTFYPIPRNAMGFLDRPAMGSDLSIKKQEVQDQMRRATAADEVIQGSVGEKGRTTATEVNSTMSQAQQRFSTKINNLESEGFADLGSVLFKCTQIFVDQPTAVRIVGPEGVKFKDYDPMEYNGEYEPHCKLESTIQKMKMERGQKDDRVYETMMQNPVFDQKAIGQWIVKKRDPDITDEELGKLMAPPAPPPEPVQVQPIEQIQFNYKDATPFAKYQIEKKFELEPDPSHIEAARTGAMREGAIREDLEDPTLTADGAPIPAMQPQAIAPPAEAEVA